MKDDKRSNGSDVPVMLDRSKCFEVVAAAVKDAVADSVVDLKCPEVNIVFNILGVLLLFPLCFYGLQCDFFSGTCNKSFTVCRAA